MTATHGYKCNSRWYADRDARLIEDYRRLGLEQAAERAGLSADYSRDILLKYGAYGSEYEKEKDDDR